MFYDDDLGTENIFFPVCLISEYASFTINVYLYSIHLGIWNVTAVFQFPFKTKAGTRAFSVAAPTLWNSLPVSVKSEGNIVSYRRRLKTDLFNAAYPP